MDFFSVLLSIAGAGILIGTVTDLRTREVPDWVNFALIFSGFGLRLIYSLITWDYWPFLYGVFGFGAGYLIALGMYYTGQWGGGDSKMIMGIGSLMGLSFASDSPFIGFLMNLLIMGAIYGMVWMLGLIIYRWKWFLPQYKRLLKETAALRVGILICGASLLAWSIFMVSLTAKFMLLLGGFFVSSIYFVWVAIKAVEKSCMIKELPVRNLTEGDWIVKDVKVGGKIVVGPKDLGINKKQIATLQKSAIKTVMVKEGIPFIPSFLLAFVALLLKGNLIYLALSSL